VKRTIYVSVYEDLLIRVAVTENGELVAYETEAPGHRPVLGQIHRAVVSHQAKGLDAVYVSLGDGTKGFLHRSDIYLGALTPEGIVPYAKTRNAGTPVEKLPDQGTPLLVQVKREAFPGKEVQVTTDISFPGYRIVLRPYRPIRRISKALKDRRKRDAIHGALRRLPLPDRCGIIVRTAGVAASREQIEKELVTLLQAWEEIVSRAKSASKPQLLYQEPDILERIVRDSVGDSAVQIIVNHKETRNRLKELIEKAWGPDGALCQLYRGSQPLFDAHKVADKIRALYNREIPLPSGGSLVIDYTEAFTAVDVNSGPGSGEDPEQTALHTNLEAAEELFRQLKLRNIGGLIVCNFISMKGKNRRRLERRMAELAKDDSGHVWVGPVNKFGLGILTRKNQRPVMTQLRLQRCPHCEGGGWNVDPNEKAARLLDDLSRLGGRKKVTLGLSAALKELVENNETFKEVVQKFGKDITISELAGIPGYFYVIR